MTGGARTGKLAALVDGEPLPDEAARALWERFSAFMEANRGDLAGFAKREGFASVHPGVRDGCPVLVASRTAPQLPYGPVAHQKQDSGGSDGRQKPTTSHRRRPRHLKK